MSILTCSLAAGLAIMALVNVNQVLGDAWDRKVPRPGIRGQAWSRNNRRTQARPGDPTRNKGRS
jgi:hypothetical protein